jgi:hypothetical protein
MAYIGSTPTTQSFISGTDYFNGTGSQTSFTLSRPVGSVNDIQAVVNNVVQVPNDAYNVSGTSIVFTSAPSAGTGNVYVRYLSTTTQSITPSQNTVAYNTFNSDMQGTFGGSFKNRIINGAMMIDQRNAGASVTNTAGATTYTLDRWALYGDQASKFTVQQSSTSTTGFINSLLVTSSSSYSVGASEIFNIQQRIEGLNCADLAWGTANAATVTMSFWVRSSLTGTFGGSIMNSAENRNYPFTYTISAANTWEQKSVTIAGDQSGTWITTNGIGIRIFFSIGTGSSVSGTAGAWAAGAKYSATGATSVVGTNGATFYITGVQLEKGSTATSFDYRPYGTELQLCQRYCWKVSASTDQTLLTMGAGGDSTSVQIFGNYIVPMRSTPTVTSGSLNVSTLSGSTYAVTSDAFISNSSSQSYRVFLFVASGLTTDKPYFPRSSGANGFIQFSAEL